MGMPWWAVLSQAPGFINNTIGTVNNVSDFLKKADRERAQSEFYSKFPTASSPEDVRSLSMALGGMAPAEQPTAATNIFNLNKILAEQAGNKSMFDVAKNAAEMNNSGQDWESAVVEALRGNTMGYDPTKFKAIMDSFKPKPREYDIRDTGNGIQYFPKTTDASGNLTPINTGVPVMPKNGPRWVDAGDRQVEIGVDGNPTGQEIIKREKPGASSTGSLSPIVGPDGKPVLVPRAEAIGKTPWSVGMTGSGGVLPPEAQAAATAGIKGDDFLKTLPNDKASIVKSLTEGRLMFPGSFALKTPYWQEMLQAVSQYDPNFDAVNYNARSKTRNDFTSGKSAQQINAINTVMGHLGGLSDAAEALGNTRFPLANTVKNAAISATGGSPPGVFNTTAVPVVDELVRVYRQMGGSEQDVKAWTANLNNSQSPEQLHNNMSKLVDLIASKMSALQDQYDQGMGIAAGGIKLMNSKAQAALAKIKVRAEGQQGHIEGQQTPTDFSHLWGGK